MFFKTSKVEQSTYRLLTRAQAANTLSASAMRGVMNLLYDVPSTIASASVAERGIFALFRIHESMLTQPQRDHSMPTCAVCPCADHQRAY